MDGLLALYTYHEYVVHDEWNTLEKSAVRLIEGGPTNRWNGYYESVKYFPKERLLKSLSASIKDGIAELDDDRKYILNSLVGRSGDDLKLEPFDDHEKYELLNIAVRGVFVSTQAGLTFAYHDENKDNWNDTLYTMKHSVTKSMYFYNLAELKAEDVADVFRHLPIGLERLKIIECPHGRIAIDALLDWLENPSTNLKDLEIWNTCVGGEVDGKECGDRLAKFLARDDCKIEHICLCNTDLIGTRNVYTWIECLKRN